MIVPEYHLAQVTREPGMNRTHAWVIAVMGVAILGLTGCSPTREIEGSLRSTQGQAGPAQPGSDESAPCPESLRVSLDQAILGSILPVWMPSHPLASPEVLARVCLEPGGGTVELLFSSTRPPEAPLWFDGISIWEGQWGGGDPMTEFEGLKAAYPEDTGKAIHTVRGVPAISDAAHDGDNGNDPAYLELVLGDTWVQLYGGESVQDLVAIAETLHQIAP